jgi:hypothetical protein
MMARASRKFAIPYGAQFPAQGLLGDVAQKPPTHDAVNRRDRFAIAARCLSFSFDD